MRGSERVDLQGGHGRTQVDCNKEDKPIRVGCQDHKPLTHIPVLRPPPPPGLKHWRPSLTTGAPTGTIPSRCLRSSTWCRGRFTPPAPSTQRISHSPSRCRPPSGTAAALPGRDSPSPGRCAERRLRRRSRRGRPPRQRRCGGRGTRCRPGTWGACGSCGCTGARTWKVPGSCW